MKQYGYIYESTYKYSGIYYIGKHKGEFEPKYHGSGKVILNIIKKHGNDVISTRMIDHADSKDKLCDLEIAYIKAYRLIYGKKGIYNIADGGEGGSGRIPGWHHTEETKMNLSKVNTGKVHLEETINKLKISANREDVKNRKYETRKKNGNLYPTIETKLKMKKAKVGKPSNFEGKHHSKETKENNSKLHLGRIYIHSIELKINKRVKPEELQLYLDNGYKLGAPEISGERIGKAHLGRVWVHSIKLGISKMLKPEVVKEYLEDGYELGMSKVHMERNSKSQLGRVRVCNYDLGVNKYVKTEELQEYLNNGYILGMLKNK